MKIARLSENIPKTVDMGFDEARGPRLTQAMILESSVIDLFSGAGGMAEGFRKAGIGAAVASDYDPMAAKTFSYNHPEVPTIVGDISAIPTREFLETASIQRGKVFAVCGGPPCQGFSLAGQRLLNDPRNQLFSEFVRVVEQVGPRFFVFENVQGIVSFQGGLVLQVIINEFSKRGYHLEYGVLNAAEFGVPQARPRFIMIGSREGERNLLPIPTHGRQDVAEDLFTSKRPLRPFVTAWDALSDLPTIDQGGGAEVMEHQNSPRNIYQEERRGERNPGVVFNHRATSHSPKIQERYAAIPLGGDAASIPIHLRTKKTNIFKIDPDRPSRTVTCNHRTDLIHPYQARGTTVREAARLQSFDDDYRFFGNLTRKAKYVTQDDQAGNAVPPLLAKAIAERLSEIARKSQLTMEAA